MVSRKQLGLLVALQLTYLWAAGIAGVTRAWAADPVPAAAMKEAEEIWKTRCSTCHGQAGKGDGPAGLALNPKPRDLTLDEWQKSVTDEHIEKIIVGGGPAVGKSPLMPPNPDLGPKPDVVKGLRVLVRGLAGKK